MPKQFSQKNLITYFALAVLVLAVSIGYLLPGQIAPEFTIPAGAAGARLAAVVSGEHGLINFCLDACQPAGRNKHTCSTLCSIPRKLLEEFSDVPYVVGAVVSQQEAKFLYLPVPADLSAQLSAYVKDPYLILKLMNVTGVSVIAQATGLAGAPDRSFSLQAPSTCGNGQIEPPEQCDNYYANGPCPATCSTSCTINSCPAPTCPAPGVSCADDSQCIGNPAAGQGYTCQSGCCVKSTPVCGNKIVEAGEQCDPPTQGGQSDYCPPGLFCSQQCQCLYPSCPAPGISCADTSKCISDPAAGQNYACKYGCCLLDSPLCGNGIVDAGEECDDGNKIDADACLSNCKAAKCNDKFIWTGHEECDPPGKDCYIPTRPVGNVCSADCTKCLALALPPPESGPGGVVPRPTLADLCYRPPVPPAYYTGILGTVDDVITEFIRGYEEIYKPSPFRFDCVKINPALPSGSRGNSVPVIGIEFRH